MQNIEHPGRTVFYDELWWVMLLDASAPHQAHMHERFYLADAGEDGCRKVIEDVKKSAAIPMFAIPLEQIQGILQRFEQSKQEGKVIDLGLGRDEAWLVWLDRGQSLPVVEQWVYTGQSGEAEVAASGKWPEAAVLLRAALSTLQAAEASLRHIHQGDFAPIWLDLRAEPRHLSAAELMELKIASAP